MVKRNKIVFVLVVVIFSLSIFLAELGYKRRFFSNQDHFKVVPAYEGQAAYISAVRSEPSADKDVLYRHHVTDQYQETCGSNGLGNVNPTRDFIEVGHPLGNLDDYEESVQKLINSDIVQIAREALKKAFKSLPGSKMTVCIFAIDPIQEGFIVINMNGVYGSTISPAKFMIGIAPKGDWLDWVPYTIAHEYAHTIEMQEVCYPECDPARFAGLNLLDFVITEGKADSFARYLYPEMEAPWTKALPVEQELIQWQVIQDGLTSGTPPDVGRVLFGDQQFPLWTGYKIGFHIVQKYIQGHPDAMPADWIKLDAETILSESGYAGQ